MEQLLITVILIVIVYYATKEIVKAVLMGIILSIVLYSSYFVLTNVFHRDFEEEQLPKTFREFDSQINEFWDPGEGIEYRKVR